jgi:hypothetical protein
MQVAEPGRNLWGPDQGRLPEEEDAEIPDHFLSQGEGGEEMNLCKHTGLECLPSGNGLTLTCCCHEDSGSSLPVICEIENQKKCRGYEVEE